MPEVDDPAIKLFGRNITSPDNEDSKAPQMAAPSTTDSMDMSPGAIKAPEESGTMEISDNDYGNPISESPAPVSPTQQDAEAVNKIPEASKAAALKKPEKILPCPRCNSMETKFCYFNNYNVNQPRHFCRNCQRYWTVGGTIRNVPVGAGRRKNKHSSIKLRPLVTSSNGEPITQVNLLNSSDQPSSTSRGSSEVLKINTVANKLTLEEPNELLEGSSVALIEKTRVPSPGGLSMRENGVSHDLIFGSSNGATAPLNTQQGFPDPPCPWNLAMAYGVGPVNAFLVPWNSPTLTMIPEFCVPNITFPFTPPFHWGCDVSNINLSSARSLSPTSSAENSSCSRNTSPSLGKHSREDEANNERCLWVPKTLRIDDPEEAAKSSIWSTLGIKPCEKEPILKGGIFKAFQSRTERKAETSEASKALQANPVARSRSHAFQESA